MPANVFIKPPGFEELETRLRSYGTETEEAIQNILDSAEAELEYADCPGVYDIIIVNDDLERAYQELERLIYGLTG